MRVRVGCELLGICSLGVNEILNWEGSRVGVGVLESELERDIIFREESFYGEEDEKFREVVENSVVK